MTDRFITTSHKGETYFANISGRAVVAISFHGATVALDSNLGRAIVAGIAPNHFKG